MSGHNKWSTIKRKKGAADQKRSKIFSRIVKEIQVSVRESGADPEGNPRLRMAIQNAKGANMPKDNIDRAINKASGDGANYQEMTFEGYSSGGVAIFIECLSDNNNRTISNMRAIFNKRNGSLGNNGCLSFIFSRKGIFEVPKGTIDPEEFELEVIDAGAENLELVDDKYIITTSFEDFGNMQRKLEKMKIEPENAELQRIPNIYKKVDVDTAKSVLKLVDAFEEDDDVQNVFHNMELTADIENYMNED